jgi:hypothetical protein
VQLVATDPPRDDLLATAPTRQRSPSFTSGIGNGQSSPMRMTVVLPEASSLLAVSYHCTNCARACRSATGSPEETSDRASLPRIVSSAFVSSARSAVTNACAASSAEANRLGATTAGFGDAGFVVGVSAAGGDVCAPTGDPDCQSSSAAVTRITNRNRALIDVLLRLRDHHRRCDHRHRRRRRRDFHRHHRLRCGYRRWNG